MKYPQRLIIFGLIFYGGVVSATVFVWGGSSGTWTNGAGWTKPEGGAGVYPGDDQNRGDVANITAGELNFTSSLARNGLDVNLSGGTLRLQENLQPGIDIEVSGGVLDVQFNQSQAGVVVSGGIVTGTGTVGGSRAVTFASGGTHAPGGVGIVGSQSLGSNSRYEVGSTLIWDISSASSFDMISQTGAQVNGGSIVVNILGVDFGESFWDTNQAFTISNFQNGGWFNSLTVNGATSGGNFVLSNPAGGGALKNTIYWDINAAPNSSPIPEPGGVLAGLILAVGLLHRRRWSRPSR